jgi:hypothetical protein
MPVYRIFYNTLFVLDTNGIGETYWKKLISLPPSIDNLNSAIERYNLTKQ